MRRNKAFTLAELLVVLGIMTLVTMVSIPAFMKIAQGSRLRSAARLTSGFLRTARNEAITQNKKVYCMINPDLDTLYQPEVLGKKPITEESIVVVKITQDPERDEGKWQTRLRTESTAEQEINWTENHWKDRHVIMMDGEMGGKTFTVSANETQAVILCGLARSLDEEREVKKNDIYIISSREKKMPEAIDMRDINNISGDLTITNYITYYNSRGYAKPIGGINPISVHFMTRKDGKEIVPTSGEKDSNRYKCKTVIIFCPTGAVRGFDRGVQDPWYREYN